MRTSVKRTFMVIAVVLVAAGLWLGRELRHGHDTTLLAASLAGFDAPWSDTRPRYRREETSYRHAGADYLADLYLPDQPDAVRAGLVLVPGAAPGGRRDARLVEFAGELARSGFAVVSPDIRSLRELQLRPSSADEIAAAFEALARTPELATDAQLGIGAFSVATGPVVLSALEPALRDAVAFLLLIGGYHDLPRTLKFLTTGVRSPDGASDRVTPDRYGKWVYAMSNARLLSDEADRETLSAIATARLEDGAAPAEDLVDRLGPEGRAVYAFVSNEDPDRFENLFERLPAGVRADVAAMNLARLDLSPLRSCFILVHGLDDAVIPFTESVSLMRALPPGRARLFLLSGLHHVDRDIRDWRDGWRMWRALQLLLMQRSPGNPEGCP